MMFYRKFEGALDGKTLDELKHLFFENYYDQTHSAEERVKDCKTFLDEQSNGFFGDYFSDQFLVQNPSEQVMSENDNCCHFLEVMASYVILGDSDNYPFDRSLFPHDL